MKKNIVVFTGAGISAESGLQTFRGAHGLWEGVRVEDVATPQAWQFNPEMVQEFYNTRRKACMAAQPNEAHRYLVDLEQDYRVRIITQNIDDLHERAGSKEVLHLHGEIRKAQSSRYADLVFDIEGQRIEMGDRCPHGSQLRPHVVWFGEPVPNMVEATKITAEADCFIVIGTSLQVYPAANLLHDTKSECTLVLIDPHADKYRVPTGTVVIAKTATAGVKDLDEILTK